LTHYQTDLDRCFTESGQTAHSKPSTNNWSASVRVTKTAATGPRLPALSVACR